MIGPVLGAKDIAIGPSTGQGDAPVGSLSHDPKGLSKAIQESAPAANEKSAL